MKFKAKRIIDAKVYKLTYGEAIQLELSNVQLINGKWQKTIEVINKPERMKRKEAGRFYSKKIALYFKGQML